ncbi:hypothetical protein HELRODRAFT_177984 [Helobdella robusta]|uniref:Uncharacterized protein n=1 Tax=Helobdella robusta TaxID=6412 RepID=T1FCK5_HELRO|nr:hypothetical protein HELRODRAFT_177984 [Helobdella robusta]ESN97553.1 hypothetical protein HELRODRAFT_177984 [Helobdella robusta]
MYNQRKQYRVQKQNRGPLQSTPTRYVPTNAVINAPRGRQQFKHTVIKRIKMSEGDAELQPSIKLKRKGIWNVITATRRKREDDKMMTHECATESAKMTSFSPYLKGKLMNF